MISKAKIKFIRSLEQKKQRRAEKLFVAEGPKVVGDIMKVEKPVMVVATPDWIMQNKPLLHETVEIHEVDNDTLRKISFLQHPQHVIALFRQNFINRTANTDSGNHETSAHSSCFGQKACTGIHAVSDNKLYLALDGVQDPGNLGTIIRIADWFGIEKIFCSHETADVWNPKVIQATMGSIARVEVVYVSLAELFDSLPQSMPVYGTMLDGEDISDVRLGNSGIIVMGNEGNGISEEIARRLTHKLLIPNYPKGHSTADSLNVAIATAITCFAMRTGK